MLVVLLLSEQLDDSRHQEHLEQRAAVEWISIRPTAVLFIKGVASYAVSRKMRTNTKLRLGHQLHGIGSVHNSFY